MTYHNHLLTFFCTQASYPERVELFLNEGWREKLCQCDQVSYDLLSNDC